MITVVVPVFNNIKITDEFFTTIFQNVVKPEEIILIDNGSTDNYRKFLKKYGKFNINYIRKDENEGVNSAWNYGISISKTPYISILNNDILLNKYFFKKVIEAMESSDDIGIVVPTTVSGKDDIHASNDECTILGDMKKREGWAFTIKKKVTDSLNPIPSNLKTYCGDDYLFYFTKKLGFKVKKILNNFIFHYGSKTVLEVWPDGITSRLEEKCIWDGIRGIKDENIITKSKSN